MADPLFFLFIFKSLLDMKTNLEFQLNSLTTVKIYLNLLTVTIIYNKSRLHPLVHSASDLQHTERYCTQSDQSELSSASQPPRRHRPTLRADLRVGTFGSHPSKTSSSDEEGRSSRGKEQERTHEMSALNYGMPSHAVPLGVHMYTFYVQSHVYNIHRQFLTKW